jgi:flagellin
VTEVFTDSTLIGTADSESKFQVGAKATTNNYINFGIDSAAAADLNSGLASGMLATQTLAYGALSDIDDAINSLNGIRGDLGSVQNRLGYASANIATIIENFQAAESVIRDVDMASEMTAFTRSQILLQAGTAMLAQANMAPQQVLALFG